MVKTLCIVQARLTSSRLPNKVLMKLGNTHMSIIEHVNARLQKISQLDKIVFAIPDTSLNDKLADFLEQKGISYYRGSEDNVLERFYKCAQLYNPELIIRATCDNPCVDWELADLMIKELNDCDYIYCKDTPLGTSVEVFKMAALSEAYKNATTEKDREHVTPYIIRNNKCKDFHYNKNFNYRLTVDENADIELMNIIYKELYKGIPIKNQEIYNFLANNIKVSNVNNKVQQKKL